MPNHLLLEPVHVHRLIGNRLDLLLRPIRKRPAIRPPGDRGRVNERRTSVVSRLIISNERIRDENGLVERDDVGVGRVEQRAQRGRRVLALGDERAGL